MPDRLPGLVDVEFDDTPGIAFIDSWILIDFVLILSLQSFSVIEPTISEFWILTTLATGTCVNALQYSYISTVRWRKIKQLVKK